MCADVSKPSTLKTPDFGTYPTRIITDLIIHPLGLEVSYNDGKSSFHLTLNLREHSPDSESTHPITRETLIAPIDIPEDLTITDAHLRKDGFVAVTWSQKITPNDSGCSVYHPGWLYQTGLSDDIDFKISHIIRGDDHLSNTAVQINLFNAFESKTPNFAHLPMIHGKDGKRLSKRHGAVDINSFIEEGYLSEAIINYLARTGWSHGDKEIFSIDELLKLFSLERVTKSAAVFDHDKLNWLNQHYIKNKKISEVRKMILPYLNAIDIKVNDEKYLEEILKLGIERDFSLKRIAEGLTYYFVDNIDYDLEIIKKFNDKPVIPILDKSIEKFNSIRFDKKEKISETMKIICEELQLKFAEVGPVIRFALTGKLKAPSIDDLCFVLGAENTLKRLNSLKSIL